MSEDRIIEKLIEHDEKLDRMLTKDEFGKFKDEMMIGQDKMITILQRLDEERVFTKKWIGDIEERVEKTAEEVEEIKLRLQIA